MSVTVMVTYILALMNDYKVLVTVNDYGEAIWEFPILLVGFIVYLYLLWREKIEGDEH